MWKILTLLVVLARLVPHPFGFTPIGAFGLFAGTHLKLRYAWMVPLIALAIGDLITGLYDWRLMGFVYAGFLAGPFIGKALLGKGVTFGRIVGGIVANAVVFFLFSNFGVWAVGFYPQSLAGLVQCYIMGLPFLGIMIAGDALYSALLFGAWPVLEERLTGKPVTI
jgi:uncharacterized protein DUF6580